MTLLVFLTGIIAPSPAHPSPLVTEDKWVPVLGDRLIIDTNENVGFLLHADGTFLRFRVASGQKRVVRYIGQRYNAATPEGEWIVRQKVIFGDRVTYGKTGRFFRLYANLGDRRTSYGIHSHRNVERWLRAESRYKSMGCVVVDERILDLIEETYRVNGEQLYVVTMHGIDEQYAKTASLQNQHGEVQ